MNRRNAERRARKFIADHYGGYGHWHFDLCEEELGRTARGAKVWSFGLEPDQEDADYEPGRHLVGYVHAYGDVEGMY